MSDYLWDRTGEPDAEVERLEALLASFGHAPRPLELPAEESPAAPRRRFRPWLHFIPARLFEPVGLVAASALLLTFLLGAGALMRGRVTGNEEHAASRDVRPAQPQPSPRPSSNQTSSGRQESPSESQETATAERGPESADVTAKGDGGVPLVQGVERRRVSAPPVNLNGPRQRPAATAVRVVERENESPTLETMAARGREGAATLFDSTRMLAKEQLIYALRLTGAKLKDVERKTHGADDSKRPARGGVR